MRKSIYNELRIRCFSFQILNLKSIMRHLGFRSAYYYLYSSSCVFYSGQSLEKMVYTPPLYDFLNRLFSRRYGFLNTKGKCVLYFLIEIPQTYLVAILIARIKDLDMPFLKINVISNIYIANYNAG